MLNASHHLSAQSKHIDQRCEFSTRDVRRGYLMKLSTFTAPNNSFSLINVRVFWRVCSEFVSFLYPFLQKRYRGTDPRIAKKKKKNEIQEGDSKGQISRLHFHRKRIALGCFPDKPLLKCAESPPKNKGKKYKCQYPMDCYYLLLSLHLKSKC